MGALFTLPLTFLAGIVAPLFPEILHWLKWMISYVYVYIDAKRCSKRFDLYDFEALHDPEKIGYVIPEVERRLETPLKESLLHQNADDIFCYGVNGKDECLLVLVSRRCNQESQATVYLKLSNGKTYSLPQDAPQYQQPSADNAFSCGGLKICCITPMRKWRILFSGFLRECTPENTDTEKTIYVKFSFLWKASSDLFDSLSDISVSELTRALSAAKWKFPTPPLKRLHEMLDFYCQAGMLYGTVKTEETPEEYEMWLWGERVRVLGDVADVDGVEFFHTLGYTTVGKIMHVGKISIPNVVENLHFGFLVNYNNIFYTVDKAEIHTKNSKQDEDENICNNMEIDFSAGQKYKLSVRFENSVPSPQNDNGWYRLLAVNHVKISCGQNSRGSGLVISGSSRKATRPAASPPPVLLIPKVHPLVVKFTDLVCQILDLTGGKGSSLAKLTALREEKEKSLFTVPKGVVVTTAAYQQFTEGNFQEAVKYLEDVAYGKKSDNLQAVCERLSEATSQRILPERLCGSIEDSLSQVFSGNINTLRFAVRSSATGEDTEELSAAGQMDTYLGVKGLKEILTAVKKCWASQFKFVPIEYKRRNGQPLNSPMAVVIQEMVPCDVAGVLFTCDPVSGNPSLISITANFGLGESVVSGSVEPDTVTLRRNHRNELHLESYEAGMKAKRIVMSGEEGIEEELVDESMRQVRCLSDETALTLAKIALLVEQSYRTHRDIEWGTKGGEIYLFQARPVTSISGETDFEIIHEFDGPLRCEKEYFSVVNVGEVMPGATSPLGLDVLQKFFGHVFQQQAQKKLQPQQQPPAKYYSFGLLTFCNHFMFSLFMLLIEILEEKKDSWMTQSVMIGMFGRIIDDPEIIATGKELHADSGKKRPSPFLIINYILNMLLSGRHLRSIKKNFQNYHVPVKQFRSSQELFDEMMYRCTDFAEVCHSHMSATYGSSMWNSILCSTLASNKGGFDTEVYKDLAYLLATCTGVESADVPSAMQNLANSISKEIDNENFKAMDPEEALEWLQESSGDADTKFKAFLERHGHRCLKEFDVHSVTWGTDPKPLVKLLQGFVGNVSQDTAHKKDLTMSEVLSGLSISLNFKSRLLLRFVLPQSRRGVRERESTKSVLIKCFDGWRKAYSRLAEMMVHEGRIPDKDLFFFFTLEEIQDLIKTSSSRLIAKANHRRRLFPEMDKYIFPEIMKGVPRPICGDEFQSTSEEGLIMKGVPVSQGVAKGNARVAITLQEAALLKPGEILITYSTDIGWSPYFPILGGVVTEIGGLISHGAVVAREYGLPCVVGLHGATRQFRTGDCVLLDGNRGILQRLDDDDK